MQAHFMSLHGRIIRSQAHIFMRYGYESCWLSLVAFHDLSFDYAAL